ncbi:MAG: non-canonical purine NTP pyrophosphatase [Chloroflexi bacterium]|nr:MAG: non-canonical purine NTP pyrophosphatase [Chloroflexota bacterium]
MLKLYFVSSNEEKFREIRLALDGSAVEVERIALDLPELQSLVPAEVAAYKARKAYEKVQHGLILVEDTGLAVHAWSGFPGALIKWVLATIGEAGMCRQLDAWDDRRATATVALCVADGTEIHTFIGQSEGRITHEPRGTWGFGWDSIFQPDGYSTTYGEMQRDDKMKISMRGRALDGLKIFLQGKA